MNIKTQAVPVLKIEFNQKVIMKSVEIALFQLIIILGTKIPYMNIMMAIIEYAILFFLLLNRNYVKCFLSLILFLSTSMEVSSFVFSDNYQISYCLTNFPRVTIIPYYLMVFLFGLLVFISYQDQIKKAIIYQKDIYTFTKIYIIMMSMGIFVYLFNIIINDNGIMQTHWYLYDSFLQIINTFSRFIFIMIAIILMLVNDDFMLRFKELFEELLFGMWIASVVVCALGWHGYYGSSTDIMLMPLVSSLCPMLIAIAAFKRANRSIYLFAGISFIILSFHYNSLMGSKFYIVIFLSAFVYVLKTITDKRIGVVLLIVIAIICAYFYLESGFSYNISSYYFEFKLEQLLKMFDFNGKTMEQWYNGLFSSSRYRIDEFINVLLEYFEKPHYFLFGKGIAGTITKRWGLTNWEIFTYNFSLEQINSGIFYLLHESINQLFLQSGIVGLYFLINTIKKIALKFSKNELFIPALIWFLFYWQVYLSWQIGGVAVVVCLYKLSKSENIE